MPYTNKKMKKLIIGLGEVLWDVLPEGKKLGGAPANFAYFTQQFGNDAIAVSAIGNDDLGGETIEALNSNGLKFITPRVNFPTGSVSVKLDAQGVPTYTINQVGVGQYSFHRRNGKGCRQMRCRMLGNACTKVGNLTQFNKQIHKFHLR